MWRQHARPGLVHHSNGCSLLLIKQFQTSSNSWVYSVIFPLVAYLLSDESLPHLHFVIHWEANSWTTPSKIHVRSNFPNCQLPFVCRSRMPCLPNGANVESTAVVDRALHTLSRTNLSMIRFRIRWSVVVSWSSWIAARVFPVDGDSEDSSSSESRAAAQTAPESLGQSLHKIKKKQRKAPTQRAPLESHVPARVTVLVSPGPVATCLYF